MTYRIVPTKSFLKDLKRLRKKYASIDDDLLVMGNEILNNPRLGDEVYKNCYKIRFAIRSKGKGKSGGGRIITFVKVENQLIYLLSIYDKSDQETVSDQFIKLLLSEIDNQE